MRTILSDNFSTYADGALPTVSGGLYMKPATWPAATINIVSHVARGASASDNAVCVPTFGGSLTAQWAEVTVQTYSDFLGVTAFNDGVQRSYAVDIFGGNWGFYTVNAGFIPLTSVAWPAPVPGDVVRLEAVALGGVDVQLTARLNGTLVLTFVAINAVVVTGTPGFYTFGTSPQISAFAAGDFSVPAGSGGGGGNVSTRLGETFG